MQSYGVAVVGTGNVARGHLASGSVTDHPFAPGYAHFVDCLRLNQETDINLQDTVNVHEACLAIDQSLEDNAPVVLPLPG